MYRIVLEPRPESVALKRDNWGEFNTLFDTVKYISEELLPWGYGDAYIIQMVDTHTGEVILFEEFAKIF